MLYFNVTFKPFKVPITVYISETLNAVNSLSASEIKMNHMPTYVSSNVMNAHRHIGKQVNKGLSVDTSSYVRPYTTARGYTGIIIGNYCYTKEKVLPKNIHWRCQKRSCKARCTTSHQLNLLNIGEVSHNHDPT